MTDTMVFLAVALVAAGVYIMYLHSLLSRYRAWSRQASALLMSIAYGGMKEDKERTERAEKEYGFDLYPRSEDEEA